MNHKYKVGDIITELKVVDRYNAVPATIVALGCHKIWYIVEFNSGWIAGDNHHHFFSYEDFLCEFSGSTKCWVLIESNILSVKSSNEESRIKIPEPFSINKESSLYDIIRAETRERIRQEEERRPKNSAFEFL
jgi:hypothetical protein